ncbi:hypothetical protein [Erythrobacter cryptus]|uniref:hypothetical protein n=1 Tax=Erythrobacter cryptus TaxID=196588 RepID=UPI00042799CF|nr:hypothetical protein [Erythrobacter cryptus]
MARKILGAALMGLAAASALVSASALSQAGSAGPVRYAMDAATMSGLGAMGSGGGLGAVLGMMRGGRPQAVRMLSLHHGAPTTAPPPQADHFMPATAGLGTSVRLLPPQRSKGGAREPEAPPRFERPSGRLLLFWGCGARAPAGQPVVIDFSRLAAGEVPPGLFVAPIDLPDDWQVTSANSRTYTTWPNREDMKQLPANASLVGAHRIAANYAREINFTLADDFMPPLEATASPLASGASMLAWKGLDKATGYYAWAIGAKDGGRRGAPSEMVWWASSKQQAFGGPLWDWISPAGVRKLIAAGTVMPPEQRDCTIPAEVIKAAGEALMVNLQAYGPQADFAYPPRPADARKAWKPEWIARVRFRSSTMLLPGMAGMGGLGAAEDDEPVPEARPRKPKCKGLKGLAERAAGLCE